MMEFYISVTFAMALCGNSFKQKFGTGKLWPLFAAIGNVDLIIIVKREL